MSETKTDQLMIGIITSRTCPTCGHHEVGYETADGTFCALRPGDRIGILPKTSAPDISGTANLYPEPVVAADAQDSADVMAWVPEPLRCDRSLCHKYGILIDRTLITEEISPALYEIGYRHKLQQLIEKESYTPLSVILDRFFVAPHLASGNSKQAADAMWAELDEIRAPVMGMTEWLEKRDNASLQKLIQPKTLDDLTGDALSDDQLKAELDRMSLEDFLETL